MTDAINVDNLINNILKTEDLLPGDKISKDSLMEISKKYEISPYVLATNIFKVTQNAYRGLISKGSNAKNIIILKDRIPQLIEEALKVRQIILQKENLNPGSKVNYSRLVEIAKKYGIREKILAVYVFEIPEYSFRRLKNNPNSNFSYCLRRMSNYSNLMRNISVEVVKEIS